VIPENLPVSMINLVYDTPKLRNIISLQKNGDARMIFQPNNRDASMIESIVLRNVDFVEYQRFRKKFDFVSLKGLLSEDTLYTI
jgi:hypothetical protein